MTAGGPRNAAVRAGPEEEAMVILVIDDHDLNRELARSILERAGYRVLTAEGGEAGVALAATARPAMVFLDLAMPGKDGFAVIRELKGSPATAAVPVVALTALAMRGDEERALAAGFDAYLTKPIDRVALEGMALRFAGPGRVAPRKDRPRGA